MKTKSNRTKVFYRRITDDAELIRMMDAAIIEAAKNSFKVAEWFEREYGIVSPGLLRPSGGGLASSNVHGVQNAVAAKETGKALIPENDSNVMALLDDVESLTIENQRLLGEIDKLKSGASDNEIIASLVAENRKLKLKVKEYEQTYHG